MITETFSWLFIVAYQTLEKSKKTRGYLRGIKSKRENYSSFSKFLFDMLEFIIILEA